MRERGKALEPFATDFNFSAASEIPCKKHPNSSSVGICAHCLKDRLVKLVCSECGEQRLSSCSCSDVSSSYRNSTSTMEVGSVGRVSFLIENEKTEQLPTKKEEKSEQVIFLRRSSSSCVEVKKSHGFWKIKRLFRKKRSKDELCDDKSEIWVSDIMGVSRSRSLCSFRNGGADEGSDCAGFSSAKISDVTSGIFLDSDRQFGLEDGPRRSGFRGLFEVENGVDFRGPRRINHPEQQLDRTYSVPNRSVFPAKESDFSAAMDDSAFIDFKLDESSARISGASASDHHHHHHHGGNEISFDNGGSCRVSVHERGLKRGNKSHKVWKWIFKYHPKKNTLKS